MNCIYDIMDYLQDEMHDTEKYVRMSEEMHDDSSLKEMYCNLAKEEMNHFNILLVNMQRIMKNKEMSDDAIDIYNWLIQKYGKQRIMLQELVNNCR